MATLLRTAQNSHAKPFGIQVPDQTEDAVIYVVVVVVFYAAIIIILVGTNIRRAPRPSRTNPRRVREFFRKQTVLVFDNEHTKTVKTSHKGLHALPAEGDSTVVPL